MLFQKPYSNINFKYVMQTMASDIQYVGLD